MVETALRDNKYVRGYLLELNTIFEYRLGFLINLLKPFIKLLVLISIWTAVFSITGKTSIATYDKVEFAIYLIIVSFISNSLFPWKTGIRVTDDIRLGNLTSIITKPISYFKLTFSKIFSHMSITGLYSFAVFFILAIIGQTVLGYELLPAQIHFFGFFIISILLSLSLAFCYYFIIACTAFWWGDTWSIMGVAMTLQSFLSGEIIPLHISDTLMNIANIFPFKAMVYTPATIYLGKMTIVEILIQIGVQMAWLIGLMLIARFILKKGIRRFEAQGG